jgi:nucleoid DNA-binding protein
MKMNERLTTRRLVEQLVKQSGLDRKQTEKFIDSLVFYFTQEIERNKAVKIYGLGTFKVVLVRERESVHIKTGERFIIPAHHKLVYLPDKDLKEQANRMFAFFEPIETTDSKTATFKFQVIDSDTSGKQNEWNEQEKMEATNEEEKTVFDDTLPVSSSYFDDSEYDENDPDFHVFKRKTIVGELLSSKNEPIAKGKACVETVPKPEPVSEGMISEDIAPEQTSVSKETVYEEVAPEPAPVSEETVSDEADPEPLVSGMNNQEIDSKAPDESVMNDSQSLKTETQKQPENVNYRKQVEKKKKSISPFLIMFLLIPVCVIIGSGSVTWYLYTRSKKESPKTEQSTNGAEKEIASSSLPIGMSPDGEVSTNNGTNDELQSDSESNNGSLGGSETDEPAADNSNETNRSTATTPSNTTTTPSSANRDSRAVADWLAPSSESSSSQARRVSEPNRQIEERNSALANNSRQSSARNNSRTTAGNRNTTASAPATRTQTFPTRVRLAAGSTLREVALEYYGDKVFWVYIYEHNKSRIKDPDVVAVGTELVIPAPNTYGINSRSNASLQRALQKQRQLMTGNN